MMSSQQHEHLRRRVLELTERLLDGEATTSEHEELERLLHDESARRIYLEFTDQHGRLSAPRDSAAPILVAERVTYERIELDGGAKLPVPVETARETLPALPPVKRRLGPIVALTSLFAIASCVAVAILAYLPGIDRQAPPQRLLEGKAVLVTTNEKRSPGAELPLGIPLFFPEDATLETSSGYQIRVRGSAEFMLRSSSEVKPSYGKLEVRSLAPNESMTVVLPAARINFRDGVHGLDVDHDGTTVLKAREGEANLISKGTSPRHYWPMDHVTDRRIADRIGNVEGILGKSVQPTKGLVGPGALSFDNTRESRVSLGSGGGTALATGSFALDRALTIESLVVSAWNNRDSDSLDVSKRDREIIFRKNDENRLLLLLQFKDQREYPFADPKTDYKGPVFCFGLYLIGQGYGELIIPMDGKEGRPTVEMLTDGKVHSLVALYNSYTGNKAIYFDGRLIGSESYPPGTRILSGGPGGAAIGNMPDSNDEPFTGVIDEVAVYDYPLTPWVIRKHGERVASGRNYFGAIPGTPNRPSDQFVISAGETVVIDPHFGLPSEGPSDGGSSRR